MKTVVIGINGPLSMNQAAEIRKQALSRLWGCEVLIVGDCGALAVVDTDESRKPMALVDDESNFGAAV